VVGAPVEEEGHRVTAAPRLVDNPMNRGSIAEANKRGRPLNVAVVDSGGNSAGKNLWVTPSLSDKWNADRHNMST
jgi:hypothetical protein